MPSAIRIALTFSVALGCAVAVRAQPPVEQPQQPPQTTPLEPDRPDVTNGTHIVDVGLLQMEVGVLRIRSGPGASSFGTPITFRAGLTDWIEVRVGGDGFVSTTDPITGTNSGMGNTQLGAKIRLWADPGGIPVLSILPAINLPTASSAKGLGSGQSDVTLSLLTGTDFLTRGHVDVNYGFGMIGSGPGLHRFPQHLLSASASAEIPGPVTPYLEYFWISRQDPRGGDVAAMDAGAIYVISPRFAIDGGAQWGLSRAAQPSVFAGVSVILGNILGDHGVHARQRQAMKRGLGRAHK